MPDGSEPSTYPSASSPRTIEPAVLPLDALEETHAEALHHGRLRVTWPQVTGVLRSAAPRIFEATVVPAAIAWLVGRPFGLAAGLLATLGWFYLMVALRLARRRPVPGVMLLGALLFSLRVALTLTTGNFWVYAAQPIAGSAGSAIAFLASLAARRPLAAKLAGDFLPGLRVLGILSPVRAAFTRITFVWVACNLTHIALTVSLATRTAPSDAVALQVTLGPIVTLTALAVSVVLVRTGLRSSGVWQPRCRVGG
jgi:hypothetical protein